MLVDSVCEKCGKKFKDTDKHFRRYCSVRCRYDDPKEIERMRERRRGILHTEESKRKMSLKRKGIEHTGEWIEKARKYWDGRKRPYLAGANNPSWKGGVTPERNKIRSSAEYRKWVRDVFRRDDYTCRFCKKRGGNVNADHIKSFALYPDLRLDLSNGRTLCEDCHKRVTFGWKPEIDFREDFVNAVMKFAETDKRIIFVTCDVGFSFLERFKEKFPDRFYNFGVTEQSSAIICAALALSGLRPIFYSMINFVLYRPFEMIRNGIGYHNAPVILAGVQGSIKYKMLGFSHTSKKNEDINLIDDIPNMKVYIPMKHEEVEGMVEKMFKDNNPAYIRL